MIEIAVGTELISNSDGERAVVISNEINPSILTVDGYVTKFISMNALLTRYAPTDYIYTEVSDLIKHMKDRISGKVTATIDRYPGETEDILKAIRESGDDDNKGKETNN